MKEALKDVLKPEATKLPSWLVVTAEHAIITLSKPSMVNSIMVDKITMRSPTLKESRDVRIEHPKDEDAAEMMLFTGLCEAHENDLGGLTVKDYMRLQSGWTFLVSEDEV